MNKPSIVRPELITLDGSSIENASKIAPKEEVLEFAQAWPTPLGDNVLLEEVDLDVDPLSSSGLSMGSKRKKVYKIKALGPDYKGPLEEGYTVEAMVAGQKDFLYTYFPGYDGIMYILIPVRAISGYYVPKD